MPKGFPPRPLVTHFAVYCVVVIGLAIINILSNPNNLWFLWVLGGWGIGIIAHGIVAYRRCQRREAEAARR